MNRYALACVVFALVVVGCLFVDGFALYGGLVQSKGTNFDFYLSWYGSREILQGHNPYSDTVTKQIQIGTLGHVAAPEENQYRFVYPAYLAFLILPFLPLPFALAVMVWIVFQQVLLVSALALTWQALGWRPAPCVCWRSYSVGVPCRRCGICTRGQV